MQDDLARKIIGRVFAEEGYKLEEDFAYDRDGVAFTADGYSPESRVGYVFGSWKTLDGDAVISWQNRGEPSNSGDKKKLSLEEAERLVKRAEEGKEYVAVISQYDMRFAQSGWGPRTKERQEAYAKAAKIEDAGARRAEYQRLAEIAAQETLQKLEKAVRQYISWARSQGLQ